MDELVPKLYSVDDTHKWLQIDTLLSQEKYNSESFDTSPPNMFSNSSQAAKQLHSFDELFRESRCSAALVFNGHGARKS